MRIPPQPCRSEPRDPNQVQTLKQAQTLKHPR
jgi:hypothetical protein